MVNIRIGPEKQQLIYRRRIAHNSHRCPGFCLREDISGHDVGRFLERKNGLVATMKCNVTVRTGVWV